MSIGPPKRKVRINKIRIHYRDKDKDKIERIREICERYGVEAVFVNDDHEDRVKAQIDKDCSGLSKGL